MAEDASIAHEFHKIRNKWATISEKNWDMAIWICDYRDIDIMDKFMEIEASPVGIFPDIFFRFQSIFTDDEAFEKSLWHEFLSWFNTGENNPYDLIAAFKKDGYLAEDYEVNRDLPENFQSVMDELLRLKSMLPLEDENFILYIAPAIHEPGLEKWYAEKLDNLPKQIRLAAIDIEAKRSFPKLRKHDQANVIELAITLDMAGAMKNEMDKGMDSDRVQSPSAKFQKQVRKVMNATIDEEIDLHEEVETLVHIGYQLKLLNTKATAHLTAAIAFSSKEMAEEAMEHADKAIELTEVEIDNGEEAYPLWRSSMMIKASMLLALKKKDEAIRVYEDLAKTSIRKIDAFYTMEAYRMIGFIEFQRNELEKAWKASIFSLQAGTNLPDDVRQSSTFLFAAALTYQIAQDMQKSFDVMDTLEDRFENLIGDDWKTKLQGTEMINAKYMNRKKPLKV